MCFTFMQDCFLVTLMFCFEFKDVCSHVYVHRENLAGKEALVDIRERELNCKLRRKYQRVLVTCECCLWSADTCASIEHSYVLSFSRQSTLRSPCPLMPHLYSSFSLQILCGTYVSLMLVNM
jgi:hypothetical protein